MRKLSVVAATAILATGVGNLAHAATSAQRCIAKVIAQSGRSAASTLKCHEHGVRVGSGPDAACLARAAALPAGECLTGDARGGVAAAIDTFVTDAVAILAADLTSETRRCAALKLHATATAARGTLACHATAVRRGLPADPECAAGHSEKLDRRWRKAEATGPCTDTGPSSVMEPRLAALVSDVLRALTPTPSALRGTYDVTYAWADGGGEGHALGTIGAGYDDELALTIEFDTLNDISVFGPLTVGGAITLDGYMTEGGDMIEEASGSALASIGRDEQRVDGTLDVARSSAGNRLSFAFSKPTSGTPPAFSGTYDFAFPASPSGCECASTASIALEVSPDGTATSAAAIERDTNGAQLGTFAAGDCRVSPLGELRCRIHYEPDPNSPAARCDDGYDACWIALSGTLAAADSGVTGRGGFFLGAPPLAFGQGEWTAVK
jgi:hypothetical protein